MADTPDLNELMKIAQEMQKSMKEAHEDLSRQEYIGEAGGGLVTVVMNGRHDTKRVTIAPQALQEDKAILEDLIAAANNAAVLKIEQASEQKMMQLTKKLGLPADQ
jgi:nucleoid-associated protein EbfC